MTVSLYLTTTYSHRAGTTEPKSLHSNNLGRFTHTTKNALRHNTSEQWLAAILDTFTVELSNLTVMSLTCHQVISTLEILVISTV